MKIKDIRALLIELKTQIGDDYGASEDPDDTTPAMSVTIATTDGKNWGWQTGDNSYTGGAYGFAHWHTLTLQRRSNSTDLARECFSDLRGMVADAKTESR